MNFLHKETTVCGIPIEVFSELDFAYHDDSFDHAFGTEHCGHWEVEHVYEVAVEHSLAWCVLACLVDRGQATLRNRRYKKRFRQLLRNIRRLVARLDPDTFWTSKELIRASAPQKSGTRRPMTIRFLGELPEIVGGEADITALYTAKFGAPVAGDRVFVQSNQMLDGWQDIPLAFQAVIPAAS